MINRAHDTNSSSSCVQDIIELGTWYIGPACDSVEELYDEPNRAQVSKEGDILIQSLFKMT